MSKSVVVYSKNHCPYCDRAKQLLASYNVAFEERKLDGDMDAIKALMEKTAMRTFPQIFIGDELVGGFDQLNALHQAGALANKLADA